jgi:hypothetical protein
MRGGAHDASHAASPRFPDARPSARNIGSVSTLDRVVHGHAGGARNMRGASRVPEHVRMAREWHLRGLTQALDHSANPTALIGAPRSGIRT